MPSFVLFSTHVHLFRLSTEDTSPALFRITRAPCPPPFYLIPAPPSFPLPLKLLAFTPLSHPAKRLDNRPTQLSPPPLFSTLKLQALFPPFPVCSPSLCSEIFFQILPPPQVWPTKSPPPPLPFSFSSPPFFSPWKPLFSPSFDAIFPPPPPPSHFQIRNSSPFLEVPLFLLFPTMRLHCIHFPAAQDSLVSKPFFLIASSPRPYPVDSPLTPPQILE